MALLTLSKSFLEENLPQALSLDVDYSHQEYKKWTNSVPSSRTTPAAVLVLIGYSGEDAFILYTKRTEGVETHKGQIAFPGGIQESEDTGEFSRTALRETEEEVGIQSNDVQVFGTLPSLLTTTGFMIHPVIGILKKPIHEVSLTPNPMEIAETLWISLSDLQNPNLYKKEYVAVGSLRFPIDVFEVKHFRIWGATASMTRNLLDRLNSLLEGSTS